MMMRFYIKERKNIKEMEWNDAVVKEYTLNKAFDYK